MRRSQIPVTICLIAACAILFLVDFFTHESLQASRLFTFDTRIESLFEIIPLFLYPLLNVDYIFAILWCWVLSWVGGSLERSWGSLKFAVFFFGISAASGLGLSLGGHIFRQYAEITGLGIPLTSLIVAWATINPTMSVSVWGVITVQARWIALFDVGAIYFGYYRGDPLLGLFALTGALAAYLAVRFGLMSGASYSGRSGPDLRIVNGGQSKRRPLDDAGIKISLNPLDRYRAWQQRRKLAKLLQKSGFTDREDDKRRR